MYTATFDGWENEFKASRLLKGRLCAIGLQYKRIKSMKDVKFKISNKSEK